MIVFIGYVCALDIKLMGRDFAFLCFVADRFPPPPSFWTCTRECVYVCVRREEERSKYLNGRCKVLFYRTY